MQNFGGENALMGNMETWLSASHQVYCKTAVSSTGAPARCLNKNNNNGKIEARGERWEEGKRGSLSSLFPLPIVPRALSFSFFPTSPQHKAACAGERGKTAKLEAVCFVALFPYKV